MKKISLLLITLFVSSVCFADSFFCVVNQTPDTNLVNDTVSAIIGFSESDGFYMPLGAIGAIFPQGAGNRQCLSYGSESLKKKREGQKSYIEFQILPYSANSPVRPVICKEELHGQQFVTDYVTISDGAIHCNIVNS